MKKVSLLLLIMVLLVTMVGCKKGNGDQTKGDGENVELVFWAHQEGPWNDSYEAIAKSYHEKHPNVTVKFEFYPYDEFESKIQTSLISKSGDTDIYEIWGGWGVDFAPLGSLAALPDGMASKIMEESYPSAYGSLVYDGKLYGLPMEFNIENGGMLVNLNVLNEKGLTIPTTWEDLIKTAKAATVKDGETYAVRGFDFVNWDSVTYLWLSMILSNGGNYMNEDGTFDFATPEGKAAFEELTSLVLDEQVTDLYGLTGGGEVEGYQQLYTGEALFVPRGPWCIPEGEQTFELTFGKDFSYVAMPWTGSEMKFAAETGWSLAINNNSKHQQEAFDFLSYFYSDEVLLQHDINCGMIPPKKSVATSDAYKEGMPHVGVLIDILDNAQYIGHVNTDLVKETVNDVFVDYCSGVYSSVDDALLSLNQTLNAAISN
ncbi:MAG: transporter substrate-binding protein [Clostridia bacterium]|jgi:multiple sugar transport system substrate-binding protein|nr:transporter substrate-binding protein [Clostridia bacterium]